VDELFNKTKGASFKEGGEGKFRGRRQQKRLSLLNRTVGGKKGGVEVGEGPEFLEYGADQRG